MTQEELAPFIEEFEKKRKAWDKVKAHSPEEKEIIRRAKYVLSTSFTILRLVPVLFESPSVPAETLRKIEQAVENLPRVVEIFEEWKEEVWKPRAKETN